jgi:para-nitrobenzyl esterase
MGEDIIVETTNGKVRGYSRRGVIKFKGIPYAAPPIGNLRFKAPAQVEPWSGVLDATQYSPVSIQPPSNLEFGEPMPQSEAECLTLNVWTQGLDNGKRPVMFWIHGGGFITGSAVIYDGARLVLRGDVVVVSINYRLGYLGFFYMPDMPDTTANAGLLDMVISQSLEEILIMSLFLENPRGVWRFLAYLLCLQLRDCSIELSPNPELQINSVIILSLQLKSMKN